MIIDRRIKYFSTGYAVKEKQFRSGSENWIVHHPDAILINRAIEVKRAELAERIYKADIAGDNIDVDVLSGKQRGMTFFSAIRHRLNELELRNQAAMYEKLTGRLAIIREAWDRDIPLSSLSKTWVEKYITYRLSKGIKASTIKKDLSVFSGVLKSVNHGGADYFSLAQSSIKPVPANREKLSSSDIKVLEDTKLSGLNDVARDMFLFAFYAHGMRFESVATFDVKTIKNGFIRYRMNKGQKMREIEIHPKLAAIIEKYKGGSPYLFPVVKKPVNDVWKKKEIIGSANALINTHLKRVAVICGIDKNLSTHIARHTFAYLALTKGVSRNILKDALGHSSFRVTEGYLKSLSDESINEAVRGVYD